MRTIAVTMLAAAILPLAGCATIRTYVAVPDEPAWIVFGDHTLEPLIDTSLYDQKATNFRFVMCQAQPAPDDTTTIATLSYVDIRDLTVVYPDTTAPRTLERQAPDSSRRWLAEDGRGHGPVMHWNRVPLGDRYDILELRFVAVLVDGVTGEQRARETVKRTLSRIDEKEPAWHR